MPVPGLPLTLSSVSARSAAGTGIRSVSFDVAAGAVHGILGENLSGASEVLAVIGGYLPVDSGSLVVGGVERRFAGHAEAEALGIRVVRGDPAIVPHTSVAENIYLGHEGAVGGFIRFGRLNANAAELLTRFGLGHTIDPASRAGALGPAERRVLELLRAVVAERRVLLLDEPFTGLGGPGLDLVAGGIRTLAAGGMTVVVATHRLDMLRRIASDVTVLSRGSAVETVSLTGAAPSTERLVEHMTANIRVSPRPQHEDLEPGPVVFETRHFTAYDPVSTETPVVQDVSLVARRGEIVGLAGLEGSGISELALSLFGRTFSSRVEGELLVNGRPLVATTPQESVAGGIGLSTAANLKYDLGLIGGIPSRISASMLARLARLGIVDRERDYRQAAAPAFGLGGISALFARRGPGSAGTGPAGAGPAGGAPASVRSAGSDGRTGAPEGASAGVGRPGGPAAGAAAGSAIDPAAGSGWSTSAQRHLDALGAWLDQPQGQRPVVVVLDHPTASLAPDQAGVMRDLIVELAAGGTAVLLAADDLDELLLLTSRVYTLAGGRITAEIVTRDATPAELLTNMLG